MVKKWKTCICAFSSRRDGSERGFVLHLTSLITSRPAGECMWRAQLRSRPSRHLAFGECRSCCVPCSVTAPCSCIFLYRKTRCHVQSNTEKDASCNRRSPGVLISVSFIWLIRVRTCCNLREADCCLRREVLVRFQNLSARLVVGHRERVYLLLFAVFACMLSRKVASFITFFKRAMHNSRCIGESVIIFNGRLKYLLNFLDIKVLFSALRLLMPVSPIEFTRVSMLRRS